MGAPGTGEDNGLPPLLCPQRRGLHPVRPGGGTRPVAWGEPPRFAAINDSIRTCGSS
jgi:hypothetical protein